MTLPPHTSTATATAIRQLVSKAISTEGQVIDGFTAAGLPRPDISILSDQFLAEVRGLRHKNIAAELLEKLLINELKLGSRGNLVQSQIFAKKLKKTLITYHNGAICTAQAIQEVPTDPYTRFTSMSEAEILADFPDLRPEHIRAALIDAAVRERRLAESPSRLTSSAVRLLFDENLSPQARCARQGWPSMAPGSMIAF